MSKHTPYVEETVAADCIYGDCEHEGPFDDCPHIPKVLCQGCMDTEFAEREDEPTAIEWPCVYATRRGQVDDDLKARLLAEHATSKTNAEEASA
ncbi:hypothetical protein DEI99_005180 [Curtobacterium sp. MCLR17_036]|uniref:hypothetical protein n=1 Tax=Curtobacterium sp. MCLR17_036 TaxID=2175620 RepID=UPI000DA6F9A4|nr:hypothetical protein [Curtobacterium sp. MCLR17_036]WIE65932.1 hypothetical protein DEI99_005180 [Curtobacterium sp. MCLR17_036]